MPATLTPIQATTTWTDNRYSHRPSSLFHVDCNLEFITPEEAQQYLDRNTNNYRTPRFRHVNAIAADIKAGSFMFTNASIAFDVDGVLVDGQHRLQAVVKAGKGIYTLVVRGMPKGSSENPAVDTGARRSVATHLGHKGFAKTATLASCARMLHGLHSGSLTHSSISDVAIAKIVENHPSIQEAVLLSMPMQRLCFPKIAATWTWLHMHVDVERVKECIDVVAGQRDVSQFHPFVKLRDVLLDQKRIKGQHSREVAERTWQYLASAWKKAIDGESCKQLRPMKKAKAFAVPNAATDALCEMWGAK